MTNEILMGKCGVCGDLHEFSSFEWRSNPRLQFRCCTCEKLRFFSYAGKKAIKSDSERID